jgi:hypothetical protein
MGWVAVVFVLRLQLLWSDSWLIQTNLFSPLDLNNPRIMNDNLHNTEPQGFDLLNERFSPDFQF